MLKIKGLNIECQKYINERGVTVVEISNPNDSIVIAIKDTYYKIPDAKIYLTDDTEYYVSNIQLITNLFGEGRDRILIYCVDEPRPFQKDIIKGRVKGIMYDR